MSQHDRAQQIRDRLNQALHPMELEIEDESHMHAGHASAKGGGHFVVRICAEAFRGKTPIQRHRLVYAAMGELMKEEVHALSIVAQTPEELLGR